MSVSRILITLGIILVIVGLLWPYLKELGVGRLPGDIVVEKEHGRFYFPITTSIIISLVLTLLFWLLRK